MLRDLLLDSKLDDSLFEAENEDKVKDDRHIVNQTLSKGSFGREHRRRNSSFSIEQKIDSILLAKELNNVRGAARYFGVL
jgi:hypothetical protein